MGWEDILKRKKYNYAILKQVIEEVISDKDNFEAIDIIVEVQEKYGSEIRRLGGKPPQRKLTKETVGKILGQIDTHKREQSIEFIEGKPTGRVKRVYRKVEE